MSSRKRDYRECFWWAAVHRWSHGTHLTQLGEWLNTTRKLSSHWGGEDNNQKLETMFTNFPKCTPEIWNIFSEYFCRHSMFTAKRSPNVNKQILTGSKYSCTAPLGSTSYLFSWATLSLSSCFRDDGVAAHPDTILTSTMAMLLTPPSPKYLNNKETISRQKIQSFTSNRYYRLGESLD